MTSAADILRERAARNEQHIKFAEQSPRQATREKASRYRREIAEWRAVADLMEAGYRRYAAGRSCRFCEAEYWNTGPGGVEREWKPHKANCALAALERAITGESDATSE